jgi:hypothetical protein
MNPAQAFANMTVGRLRRGRHYFVDEESDDPDDGPPHFGECTPEQRITTCPVCAAVTPAGVPEHVIETYHVACPDWQGGCIMPDLRSALDIMGEELDGQEEPVSFTVDRLWMVRADMDRLPEFEG